MEVKTNTIYKDIDISILYIMNIESKDDRRKRFANARQKKYYKANADRIKKEAQGNRDEFITLRAKCDSEEPLQEEPVIENTVMTVFIDENIVNGINALTINEHTKNKYMRDIRIGM